MAGQDKADDELPKSEVTRRGTFGLAAAVAAFGAAMGLQAPTAQAAMGLRSRKGGGSSGAGAIVAKKAKKKSSGER